MAVMPLAACSTNPATGQSQFAAFMSPEAEENIGAEQHRKIIKLYGMPKPGDPVQRYVEQIGQRVAAHTERPEVRYRFFVIDTPIVNAFAIPGGYIYVSRGLINQANSEAELAAVLAHEVGHITARHSAERYSHGVLTSVGASIISSAIDKASAARALGLGSQLYLSAYSRQQEHQADDLGIRYLHRAGYDPFAMAFFLQNLDQYTFMNARIEGKEEQKHDYFSTHPQTSERVAEAWSIAHQYPPALKGSDNRDSYLKTIDGQEYGHSAREGFVKGTSFYHPTIGFMFEVPEGFKIENQPAQVVATDDTGTIILFDGVGNSSGLDPYTYMTQEWMKNEPLQNPEPVDINGLQGATASFNGTIKGRSVSIRIVTIAWDHDTFFRFQIAIPRDLNAFMINDLKRTTYSLRRLTQEEIDQIKPFQLKVIRAEQGDTIETMSQYMGHKNFKEERFRMINALRPDDQLQAGRLYKIVVAP